MTCAYAVFVFPFVLILVISQLGYHKQNMRKKNNFKFFYFSPTFVICTIGEQRSFPLGLKDDYKSKIQQLLLAFWIFWLDESQVCRNKPIYMTTNLFPLYEPISKKNVQVHSEDLLIFVFDWWDKPASWIMKNSKQISLPFYSQR